MSKKINYRGLDKDLYTWICSTKDDNIKDISFQLRNVNGGAKIIPYYLMKRFIEANKEYTGVTLRVFTTTLHYLKRKNLIEMKRIGKADRPSPNGTHESQYKIIVSEKAWYSKPHDKVFEVIKPIKSEFKVFSLEDTRKIVSGALANPNKPLYYPLPVESSHEAFEAIQNTVKSLGLFCRFKEVWDPKTGKNVVDKKTLVFGSEV